jgi:excisionase family DNA binding protein
MAEEDPREVYAEALRELSFVPEGRSDSFFVPEGRSELRTVGEAAERLRVSTGTIYRHVSTGALRAVRLGTGEKAPIRIPEDALDDFTRETTIGADVAERAAQLVARRGESEDDADAYFLALKDLEVEAEVFADRVRHVVHAQVEEAERRGYFATAASRTGSDVVDVERIVLEELKRLGDPLPVEIAQMGPKGLGREALRILKDKGVTEYDEAGYRAAIRQAIREALNPKRKI